MKPTSNRILITGATGFVGSALTRFLVADPTRVVCAAVRMRDAVLPPGVEEAVVGDLSAATDWRQALTGVDCVVHLAGRAHVLGDTAADPVAEYRKVNVDATMTLARQAVSSGVRRLIFLSSVKVNGEFTVAGGAFSESDTPAPLSTELDPYGASKLEAERGLLAIAVETGLEVVIIRPPLIYGPGVKANFAALIRAVRRGIPLPLGAVHNRRSLIGLDNLLGILVICINHPAAANQIFLVSDGEDLSTTDLIRRLGAAMQRPVRLIPVPEWLLAAGAALVGKGAPRRGDCWILCAWIAARRGRSSAGLRRYLSMKVFGAQSYIAGQIMRPRSAPPERGASVGIVAHPQRESPCTARK